MEEIVLYLKLLRDNGVLLAYVVRHHIKVLHIIPTYSAYLNFDEEIMARAPIVGSRLNEKLTQECLEGVYLIVQCDMFKIDDALVYYILLKIFIDIEKSM